MVHNEAAAGGQGAVEFDDSREAGSVESRLSLLRALVEDIARSGEASFTHQIMIDDKIWTVRVEPTTR